MGLRRADPRFALPRPVRSAVVLGRLAEWRDGLDQAGVETSTGSPGGAPDLVVAPAALADQALALKPELLLLEGGGLRRRLRAESWSPLVLLPLPEPARPELLLPAGHPAPVRYAIRHWRTGTSRLRRARNVLAGELLARGVVPPGRQPVTAAARRAGPPFLVAAALDALPVDRVDWFAAFGLWAHPFSRGAFYLFAPGEPGPSWVLKFARVPGLEHLFDEDERGLRLAERSGPIVSAHAPRLIARVKVDALEASVETAAVGERLSSVLTSPLSREQRLAVIGRVADWIVRLSRETAAPPEALESERRRLATSVVRRWAGHGLPHGLLDRLPPVPAVLQHGDLWADHVFLREDGFTVVDWESAREHGLPLWDLAYFLTDALAIVDEVGSEEEREEHFVRLWLGELPSSEVLFRWTRAAVEATSVPPEAVGPLVTLLWLSYALLDAEHVERVEQAESEPRAREPATWRFAQRWLSEPGLGPDWSRWRG